MIQNKLESENDNDDNYNLILMVIAANYPERMLKTELMKYCWLFLGLGNLSKIVNYKNYSMEFGANLLGGADVAVENNLRLMENDEIVETDTRVSKEGNEYELIRIKSDRYKDVIEAISSYFEENVDRTLLTWNDFVEDMRVLRGLLGNEEEIIGFLYELDTLRTKKSIIKDKKEYKMLAKDFLDKFLLIYEKLSPIFPLAFFYDIGQTNYVMKLITQELSSLDQENFNELIEIKAHWIYSIAESFRNHYINYEIQLANIIISNSAAICAYKSHTSNFKELEKYFTIIEGLWRYNLTKRIPLELIRSISLKILSYPKNIQNFNNYILKIQNEFQEYDLEITPVINKNLLIKLFSEDYVE